MIVRGASPALVAVLISGVSSNGQDAAAPYVIGPNIQVSAAQPALRHYETYAGADPRRATHLIACAYVTKPENGANVAVYTSFDQGATWSHKLTLPDAVDPSCEIAPSGIAFAAAIHDQTFADGKSGSVVSVQCSRDAGRTWAPSSIEAGTRSVDRAYLTVDGRRVYVHAYRNSKSPPAAVLFAPSTDGGRSFGTARAIEAPTFEKPWFFPGNGVADDKGNFFALLAELDDTKRNMSYRTDAASAPGSANAVLEVFASHDGGKTLRLAGKIVEVYYDWRVPQLSMPALAVDLSHGPFRGRLYAAWPDARYDHRTQILFSHSSDQGRTWAAPRIVSDESSGPHTNPRPNHFMPAIAVNRDGVAGISWYDRRDNPDNIGYWVRFAASLDGGATWLPSARVSTSAHTASEDTRKNSGDTAGLTADAGGLFHPVWIDNRTGIPQMWTASVRVRSRRR